MDQESFNRENQSISKVEFFWFYVISWQFLCEHYLIWGGLQGVAVRIIYFQIYLYVLTQKVVHDTTKVSVQENRLVKT